MNTEEQAALALLERGLEARATAPLLLRLFGKRTVMILLRSPQLGTLYRMSAIMLEAGLTDEALAGLAKQSAPALYRQWAIPVSRVLAYGWVNGCVTGRLLNRALAHWLRWHLKPLQLLTMGKVLAMLASGETFRNTIELVSAMKLTGSSHKTQGS